MTKAEKKVVLFLGKNPEPTLPTIILGQILGIAYLKTITNHKYFKIDLGESGSLVGLTEAGKVEFQKLKNWN